MSNQQTNVEPSAAVQAAALLKQVTLSQAANLARDGSYSAAEQLLTGMLATEQTDANVLDLLARIRAQQGSLLEAEALWQQVLRLDSSHLGAQAGIARIRRMRRHPVWLTMLWPAAMAIGVVIVCFAALQIQSTHSQAGFARLEDLSKQYSDTTVKTVDATASALSAQIGSLHSDQQALAQNQVKFAGQIGDIGRLSKSVDALAIQQQNALNQIEQVRHDLQELTKTSEIAAQTSSNLLASRPDQP